jgi:hypothetical protein
MTLLDVVRVAGGTVRDADRRTVAVAHPLITATRLADGGF